jgi:pentatricopeptide repeat protein
MDRLYPKFNRKSQPISIIRAKRELWRKNRTKPPEKVPPIKLQNSYSIYENKDEFNSIYSCIRNWKWLPCPDRPLLQSDQARMLLGDMQTGKILKRIENIDLAVESLLTNGENVNVVKSYLPLIKASPKLNEFEALIKARGGDLRESLILLAPLPKVTSIGMMAFEVLLETVHDVKIADLIYKSLLEKCSCPSPRIVNTFIRILTKNNFPEKAFKEFIDVCRRGLQPTEEIFHSLLYTTSKNKDYFPEMVDVLRQINLRDFSVNIECLDHLLYGCSKLGNLSMALEIWKSIPECGLVPNLKTFTNMFWALASSETKDNKLSVHRKYIMEADLREISVTARDIMGQLETQQLTPDLTTMTAYLAVFCNCKDQETAEKLFTNFPFEKNQSHFEMMLGLYDSLKDDAGTLKLIGTSLTKMNPNINYAAARHAIRTLALTGNYEKGCDILHHQIKGKVKYEDVKELYHSALSDGNLPAMRFIKSRCLKLSRYHSNPYSNTRKRSIILGNILSEGYGQKGPKVTTDPPSLKEKLRKAKRIEMQH